MNTNQYFVGKSATISIELYPVDYSYLWGFLENNSKNVLQLGLNTHIGALVIEALYTRKYLMIRNGSFSSSKKPRRLTMKPIEAKALYEELKFANSPLATIIFSHLDRALLNAGFRNSLNQ